MTAPTLIASSPKQLSHEARPRGLSPIRSPANATHSMQPARTSPVIRPRSPLSPRYDSSPRFETLRPTSPRSMNTRTDINQRRANPNGLKLPALPRFHPSNFPSAQSSNQGTPDAGHMSPQGPLSPRLHQRVISDAQKHLLAYQREMMSAAARSSTPTQLDNPESPRLLPLGSPGPVTPLQLEGEDGGYLVAGTRGTANDLISPDQLVEKLVKEEAARHRRSSSRQSKR